MNYQEFLKKGFLKKEKIEFDQVVRLLERASRSLKSARILIKNNDQEGGFRFAYEAMLLTGRALVFSHNLRPRTVGSHRIVVNFTEKALGKDYRILVQKFNKMRKKRNYLIYEGKLVISKTEAENSIKTAEKFERAIEDLIQKKNPQQRLSMKNL